MTRNRIQAETHPHVPSEVLYIHNLLRIAWERKSMIALGMVAGVVLGLLYYAQQSPTYEVTAEVLVVKKRPESVMGSETRMSHFEDFVSTHQELIKSPLIVDRAIKKNNLQNLSSFAGENIDLTETIIKAITVNRKITSTTGKSDNILKLSYRGKVADECSTVVNAVIQSYKDFLDETYKNISDDTVKLITQARNDLQKELAQKENDYGKFRQEMPFLLSKGKDGINLRQESLTAMESRRSALKVRRAEILARLSTIEDALKSGISPSGLFSMVIEWGARQEADRVGAKVKAFSVKEMEEQLLTLLLEEYTLKETFGPDYPQLKSVRKRIELARSMLNRHIEERAKEGGSFGDDEEKRAKEVVDLYIESLKQELVDTTRAEENLAELFARESAEARKLTKYEVEDEEYRNAIGRMQQLFNGIVKRLQDVDLLTNFGGYDARIIRPAANGLKVAPRALLIFPVALFLGLLVGGGLAYMADIRDKSFRSPEEIRHRLGLPVVGHIPLLAATPNGVEKDATHELALDPILCTYYRTKSGEAEAFRGLRTALFFSMRGAGHKVIQITSPNMADGKTTLAANLAVSVAQSGKKVLLIDADFRKPRIHKLFGLTTRVGMATVLISETEVASAIQTSGIPGLDILPCGPVPPNPAELLGLTRVKELLDLFREQYDLVLVDTAPLLVVTDPCIVAAHVDGVLLTIRITPDSRPAAERSREILATLGARVLGIVVNGIDAQAGYSRYGYGSYYSSSYYRSNGKNGYYQNSETEDIPDGAIPTRSPDDSAKNKLDR